MSYCDQCLDVLSQKMHRNLTPYSLLRRLSCSLLLLAVNLKEDSSSPQKSANTFELADWRPSARNSTGTEEYQAASVVFHAAANRYQWTTNLNLTYHNHYPYQI
ncbi:hypothetical protein PM082_014455 [Marasmius tenuissimus]|nr:hypothetical protein PM082_014455 [Marasmius tenuissimus]